MQKGELKSQFFIAAIPPPEIQEKLANIQNAATNSDIAECEWLWKDPKDYHISFAFPGALTEAEAENLIEILATVDAKAFEISFSGLSFFARQDNKDQTNTHVLWARPANDCDNDLKILHHTLIKTLKDNGFEFGRIDLSPHLTLAKTPMNHLDLVNAFTTAHNALTVEGWHCNAFALCETLKENDPDHPNQNNGEGAKYRVVKEFALQPSHD